MCERGKKMEGEKEAGREGERVHARVCEGEREKREI